MSYVATNGITVKSFSLSEMDALLDARLDGIGLPISTQDARKYVPWIRAAQTKRAGAVSSVPFEILDGENDVSEKPRFAQIAGLLNLAELSLCANGGAYWHKARNAGRFVWPEWWVYSSVGIDDTGGKFNGFIRTANGKTEPVKIDDVLYFWEPDERVELGPGQAPMTAALYAASVLYDADRMVDSYNKRGGVRINVFEVATMNDADLKGLKEWWNRLTAGVTKAFTSVFYRGKLNPLTIGDPLKDIWSEALTRDKREDIAAAFSLPVSVLLSNAANFATANRDYTGWVNDWVFPRCEWYADIINAQWLDSENLKLVFHPERTEAYQEQQLGQVRDVTAAYQAGILQLNEARDLLGFAEIDSAEEPTPQAEETPPDDPQKALQRDIEKWERYARRRYEEAHAEKALQFQSDVIPATLQASIRGALSAAKDADSVSDIFRTAKNWAGYGF